MSDEHAVDGPPRVIAVLGMHRSGTSCLTGSLQRAGLQLGRHNSWNRHNPKGNRENQDVVELHDSVLADSGGRWDDPPDTIVWSADNRARAQALLTEHAESPNWGFKDPRALLVLDGWLDMVDVELVGIIRHPVSVVESLASRGDFPRDKALDLWITYNRALLERHQHQPFPVVSFDVEPDEFNRAVDGIVDEMGLKPIAEGDEFFSDELRTNDQFRDAEVPDPARDLYAALRGVAR